MDKIMNEEVKKQLSFVVVDLMKLLRRTNSIKLD